MRRGETKKDIALVLAFATLAFLGCLVLLRVGGIYVSPDETANAFFAGQFARTGTLSAFDALNVDLGDALHPRSAVSVAGRLVPGSFLGLPVLYGLVSAAAGDWFVAFVTPLLAAFAVLAWYGVVRRVFDREIGLLSALFLAIHPAWWYYSARSLMHNVPFTAFLTFAAYLMVARPMRARRAAWADVVGAGLCLGTALFFRTSEAAWIVVAAFAAVAAWRPKTVAWKPLVLGLASVALALLPMFALNRSTYGGFLTTGYTAGGEEKGGEGGEGGEVGEVGEGVEGVEVAFSDLADLADFSALSALSIPFFPFGFSLPDILDNTLAYGLGLFWWMTALAIVGFPLAFPTRATPKDLRRPRRAYVAFASTATAYLVVLYGTWTFFDNPDPTQVTIGNSHVRYWIPAFVLSTPFAAHAARWVSRRAMTDVSRRLAAAALMLACLGLSVRATFFSPQDGLVAAAVKLEESKEIRSRALAIVEPDAVVVVDRGDKLFFPYRRVLYPLRDDRTYALMPRVALRAPLYYYGITLPQADVDYLNDVRLGSTGLMIEPVETFGIETLYRISKRE